MANRKKPKYQEDDRDFYHIKTIHPRNENQKKYLDLIENNIITIANGPPGTAKTLLALYAGIKLLDQKKVDQIIIARSIVSMDGQKSIGYLPGSYEEKIAPFFAPILQNLELFVHPERIELLIEERKIDFLMLEFLRGQTFHNSFIIIEEAQNLTVQSIFSVLSRIGDNSKIVINGDHLLQKDLSDKYGKSGLEICVEKISDIENVGIVNFTLDDIERNKIIKDIIVAFFGEGIDYDSGSQQGISRYPI